MSYPRWDITGTGPWASPEWEKTSKKPILALGWVSLGAKVGITKVRFHSNAKKLVVWCMWENEIVVESFVGY